MKNLLFTIFAALALIACSTADSYRSDMEDEMARRRQLFPRADWGVFDSAMTADEREAMTFLYASMPVADLADYSGQYFLDNARIACQARREAAWSDSLSDELFRHFVLPVRVNNENLDDFRTTYYAELKARIEGLTLAEAALEVNHWCHEHVTYTPTDARTSSPMATMRTGRGRCGEESTLAVTAMRTVGIPARQVYTPRWAHTDDNHAWIEVWANGRWNFMGACEPEPVLNLGWFNASAARAMLMHTKVFGDYRGQGDIIKRTRCYTEINMVDGYVPTRRLHVFVTDRDGQAVPEAKVEFKLYNYGEFNSVVTLPADQEGHIALTTGLGDLLVWASKDGMFGFAKTEGDTLAVTLDHRTGDAIDLDLDMVPPAEGNIPVAVTPEQVDRNRLRLAHEDSLRVAAVAARQWPGTGVDDEAVARLYTTAQSNWTAIADFLAQVPEDRRADAVVLLQHITDKDLRDTPADYLLDYLLATPHRDDSLYAEYVLSPRINLELIRPFRSVVAQSGELPAASACQARPELLVEWVTRNIQLVDEYNPQRLAMSPAGVWHLRQADAASRDVFFVALCRAKGIPARIESVTGQAQYYNKGVWMPLSNAENPAPQATGRLTATYTPTSLLPDPTYYRHFSLALVEDGVCQTLNFEEGEATELGAEASWNTMLRTPYPINTGHYLLVTGRRMASGKVLAHIRSFTIGEDSLTTVPITMRQPEVDDDISVIGNFDAEAPYLPAEAIEPVSLLSTTGRGYFLLMIADPRDEPTTHATRALESLADRLKAWNRPAVVLFRSARELELFDRNRLAAVPQVSYGIDTDNQITQMLFAACHSSLNTLPVVVIGDSFGRIVFFSQGYNTALADQLTHILDKL